MLYLQRIVLLLLLLPAAALAGESAPAAASNKVVITPRLCSSTGVFMAQNLARATLCAERHKGLAARAQAIKRKLAAGYPNFYQTITTPPYSEAGMELATGLPYLPGSDPTFTEEQCKLTLVFWEYVLTKEPGWPRLFNTCWEGPHPMLKVGETLAPH